MRSLPAFLLLPVLLMAYRFPIDHITVAGSSLARMQAALSQAGIATVYGGPHSDGVTEMALASFPDGSYLELIALQEGAAADRIDQHVWAKYLRGNAGPAAWALRAEDMAAEVRRLKAAGVAVSDPQRNGRARPDGVHLEWETSSLGSEPRGTFFPFLIHDFTPREQRAWPQGKPGTTDFRGVSGLVIAVRDLDAAAKRYRQAFGLPAPRFETDREFGARLARMNGSPVVLAQPLADDSWLGKRLQEFGEIPCAFLLEAANGKQPGIRWLAPGTLGWRLGVE